MASGIVHQHSAHHDGSLGDEVHAVIPGRVLLGQTEVGFMNQGGGLQGMIGAFLVQVKGRQTAEFVVHSGQCLVQMGWLAIGPSGLKSVCWILGDVHSVRNHGINWR